MLYACIHLTRPDSHFKLTSLHDVTDSVTTSDAVDQSESHRLQRARPGAVSPDTCIVFLKHVTKDHRASRNLSTDDALRIDKFRSAEGLKLHQQVAETFSESSSALCGEGSSTLERMRMYTIECGYLKGVSFIPSNRATDVGLLADLHQVGQQRFMITEAINTHSILSIIQGAHISVVFVLWLWSGYLFVQVLGGSMVRFTVALKLQACHMLLFCVELSFQAGTLACPLVHFESINHLVVVFL